MMNQPQPQPQPELVGYSGMGTNNLFQDANVLQIRLDTDGLLRQLHLDLLGVKEDLADDDNNGVRTELVQTGERLANDIGIQNILGYVRAMCNHITFQGDFRQEEDQEDYLVRARKDFATHMRINMYRYNIKKEDYHGIISTVFRLVELFTTGAIKAGMRNSVSQTTQYQETNVVNQPKKRFLPFFGRR